MAAGRDTVRDIAESPSGIPKSMSRDVIRAFVAELDIPEQAREALLALTPSGYIGNAASQARAIE